MGSTLFENQSTVAYIYTNWIYYDFLRTIHFVNGKYTFCRFSLNSFRLSDVDNTEIEPIFSLDHAYLYEAHYNTVMQHELRITVKILISDIETSSPQFRLIGM